MITMFAFIVTLGIVVDDAIVVGENIVVTVIEIKGGQVRIGIDAPREVDVYREEIYERIKREQEDDQPVRAVSAGR